MGAFARYVRAGCSLDLCIPTSLSCLVFQSQQLSRVYSSGDGLALEACMRFTRQSEDMNQDEGGRTPPKP